MNKIWLNAVLLLVFAFLIVPENNSIFGQCNNSVGTINGMSSFIGQSSRRTLNYTDTIFLCWNDRFSINHNDDYSIVSDPVPASPAGIGYGWYKGKPTKTGDTKPEIYTDPIWRFTGDPNMMISVDNLNGDITFENYFYSGNSSFNQVVSPPGNPTLVYYAPITVDYRSGFRGYHENNGPCVKAAPNQSFPVVYLNPIEISDIQYNVDGDPLKISFLVKGGSPEFYKLRFNKRAFYDVIEITDQYNFSHKVVISGNGISHGDRVTVSLPTNSVYQVIASDKNSCSSISEIKLTNFINPTFRLDTISVQEGYTDCVLFTGKNMEGIELVQGKIEYDPSIIEFDTIIDISGTSMSFMNSSGIIVISYTPTSGLTNNDTFKVLFWVCFKAIGKAGDCSNLFMSKFEAVGDNLETYPELENGMYCITKNGIYVNYSICGGEDIHKNDGSLNFRIFNGKSPYTYEVREQVANVLVASGIAQDSSQLINVLGLFPGSDYIITVIDANNITFTSDKIRIVNQAPLRFDSVKVTDPSCYGRNDGMIKIQVKDGGFYPHNIKWSNNSFFDVDSLPYLYNGTYGVTIVDKATGCQTDTFVNLFVPKIEIDISKLEDASCVGVGDGKIRAVVSGGTIDPSSGYTFKWQSGSGSSEIKDPYQSVYNSAQSGMVHLKVTDKNFCVVIDSVEVGYKYTMSITDSEVTDPRCHGTNTGIIDLTGELAGHLNSQYNVSFPYPPSFPYDKIGTNNFIFNNLEDGRYIIDLIETTTGCKIRDTFNLVDPPAIVTSVSATKVGCDNTQLGTAIITITGGTKPVTLTGIGSPQIIPLGGLSYSYKNLGVGSYKVYVEDANTCLDSVLFDITRFEGLINIDSLNFEPLGCNADATTDINVYASSAYGQIIYRWTDTLGINLGNTNVLSNVGAGSYIIELKDSQCTIRDTIIVPPAKPFLYNSIFSPSECGVGETGGFKGSACINLIGDDTGFSYQWSNGDNTKCATNLQAGKYYVTISNGVCSIKDSIVVQGGPPIDIDILALSGISCNDGHTQDGSIALSASGGNNPLNIYTYKINNGTAKVGKIVSFDNLNGGDNIITVSYNTVNGNVCTLTDTINISVPAKITLDNIATKVIKPSCYGECDASAILKAKGGNDLNYFYKWQETGFNGAIATGLCDGKYHIAITDANLCTVTDSIIIAQPDELVVKIDTIKTKDVNCSGSNTGQIFISFTGGNNDGPYTFAWSPNVSQSTSASNLPKGLYSVTVTDHKGCSDYTSYEVKEQVPISFNTLQDHEIKCYGGQTCIEVDNVAGGSGKSYTFSVNGGAIFPIDSCIRVFANELPYLVTVFDSEGCRSQRELLIAQPEQIIVDLGDKLVVDLGDIETISVNTNAVIDSISWNINNALNKYSYLNSIKSEIELEPSANSIIYATVIDVNGCKETGELQVIVNSLRNVYIPNIFSPDGDGRNDEFKIKVGKGVTKVAYIQIFDRWGEKIYNEENMGPSGGYAGMWNGTYSGTKLNPGVYVYIIKVLFNDNREIIYRGSITLIK
jgi:gliding motility-associated-like protein